MPRGQKRKYLPRGLTEKEKRNPKIMRKLARCIKSVEKKSCPKSAIRKDGSIDYGKCKVNPVAVCRASIKRGNPHPKLSPTSKLVENILKTHDKKPNVKTAMNLLTVRDKSNFDTAVEVVANRFGLRKKAVKQWYNEKIAQKT